MAARKLGGNLLRVIKSCFSPDFHVWAGDTSNGDDGVYITSPDNKIGAKILVGSGNEEYIKGVATRMAESFNKPTLGWEEISATPEGRYPEAGVYLTQGGKHYIYRG
jgi:hypothetical protein